jgi:hypothetical protein
MDRLSLIQATRSIKTAVSVVCLLVCLLLIALWVRSYRTADTLRWNRLGTHVVSSEKGTIAVYSTRREFAVSAMIAVPAIDQHSWKFHPYMDGVYVRFPYRLPVAVFILGAISPWIHWRFSLRTLLIAVTVLALGLGFGVVYWFT